jgi:predicted RNase H-like nuclease
MALVAGVDGCRAGWICVLRDEAAGPIEAKVLPTAADLFSQAPTPHVIAIDVPIGLPDAGRRECDGLARQMLGWPRRNSVFPAPVRAALTARTREEASKITSGIDGRRVGIQAWSIYAKIREVDDRLRGEPSLRQRVREVHPEVCFCAWNGFQAMRVSKKRRAGREERLSLVRGHFGPEAYEQARSGFRRKDVANDDILDAFAALWTAERILGGQAESLPNRPQTDSEGLRMEIVY